MTLQYSPYDYEAHENPYPIYARLRSEAPVYRNDDLNFFAISRHVGRPLLETMFHRRSVRRYLGWLDHPHFTAYFAAAIALPVAPDDLLCYLAGLTKMRVRTYVLIILLLKPWSILAYSFGVIAVLQRWLPWLGV